ncbi:MAG: hypothetical protein WCG26_16140, partial [Chloroflexales bacterium]
VGILDLVGREQAAVGQTRAGVLELDQAADPGLERGPEGVEQIGERHRHRFEFNNAYRSQLEAAGLLVSGHSPDGRLVEIIELRDHPWFVASQFHPEFLSRPNKPHPLFREFVSAAAMTQRANDPQQLRLTEPDEHAGVRAWVAVELS